MRKPTKGTAGNQKTNFGKKIVLDIKQKIIENQTENHRPTTEIPLSQMSPLKN